MIETKIQQNHPQKIIFLDVDGVLTHEDYLNGVEEDLDETKIKILKQIIDQTNAKIVLSSTWRKCSKISIKSKRNPYQVLEELLKRQGLEIYDKTPILHQIKKINNKQINEIIKLEHKRAEEILTWLDNHNPESFVILDDNEHDFKKYDLESHLIKTSYYDGGLKEEHIPQIIEILNKTNKKTR